MNNHRINGLRHAVLATVLTVSVWGAAYHTNAAADTVKPAPADCSRAGSSMPLPPRDAVHAGFWKTMDYYRFASEMRSFDLFRLQSYPYYNPQEKHIIDCMELIVKGDHQTASQMLQKLKDLPAYQPYIDIFNLLDRNLHPNAQENYQYKNQFPEYREIMSRRKFIFNQPQSTLQLYDEKLLVIDVIIDGITVPMIVDTGSPDSTLSQQTIDKFKLRLKTLHPEKTESQIKYADNVEIGKLTIQSQPFIINKGKFDLVGWDILRGIHLKINYLDQELTISQPVPRQFPGLRNLVDFGDRALIRVDLEKRGEHIYFMLDTGANSSFLQSSFLQRTPCLPTTVPLKYRMRETFDGKQADNLEIYPNVDGYLCGIPMHWKNMPIYPDIASKGLNLYGILGVDLTDSKYGSMEIDATNGRFQLSGPDIALKHYEDYQYQALLSDNVNPFARYPAIGGEVISMYPAIFPTIFAAPLGRQSMINAYEFTINGGEAIFGGIPWLLTNWFYTVSSPVKENRQNVDRTIVAICKLNNFSQLPTAEKEVLEWHDNTLKGIVMLGTGQYQNAVNTMQDNDKLIIYTVAAELRRGNTDAAAARSRNFLKKNITPDNKLLTLFLQLPAGQTKEEQMLAALKESSKEDLPINYYLMAEYYLNVKKDNAEAMKYCRKSLEYPFAFPSCYLAQKMMLSHP